LFQIEDQKSSIIVYGKASLGDHHFDLGKYQFSPLVVI